MDRAELLELLADLRSRGKDHSSVEAKRSRADIPRDLWRSVVAFANQQGGVIVLGVDEKRGFEAVGVEDAGRIEQRVAETCSTEIEPPIRPVITSHLVDDRWVVAVEVPALAATLRPAFHRGEGIISGAYIRVGDNNRKLSEYEVSLLLSNRSPSRDDRRPVPDADLGDLDPDYVGAFLRQMRSRGARAIRGLADDETLVTANALAADGSGPTLAGLLALGRYPQQFFPQLRVTFVVFPSDERGTLGGHGERFMDNLSVEGPIPEMVEELVARIRRDLPAAAVVKGVRRYNVGVYPEEALREAVVNALVHRDYSEAALGAPVQVELFPSRLVIRNPGGLVGPMHIEDLATAEVSTTRNPALLRVLEDVTFRDGGLVCEARGSGIATILRTLHAAGLPEPEFTDSIATFQVTFRLAGAESSPMFDPERSSEREPVESDAGDEAGRMVLDALRDGPVSRRQISDRTGLTARVVLSRLGNLRARGVVRQTGSQRDPHGKWVLWRQGVA